MKIITKFNKFKKICESITSNFNDIQKDDYIFVKDNLNTEKGYFKVISTQTCNNTSNKDTITVVKVDDEGIIFDETKSHFNITTDDKYTIEKYETVKLGGIVFIYNNKIFLQKEGDDNGYYTFPGGHLEGDETPKDGACRETLEEIGIDIPQDMLNSNNVEILNFFKPNKKQYCIYNFFIVRLNNKEFEKYFDGRLTLPKDNLNKKEVKHGGFYTKDVAEEKMNPPFNKLLKYL